MKRRFSAQEIAAGALMIAVIETCKMTMQSLPNIELTSFLLILFTLRFGRLCALIVPAFILIEGLIFGFGLWWLMYLYAWPALVLFTLLFAREDSSFFWAVFSGLYGVLFGPLCAIPYFFIGFAGGGLQQGLTQMFSWWVAGIPFDLIHGVSNFVIMLALYRPIHTLLERIPGVPER